MDTAKKADLLDIAKQYDLSSAKQSLRKQAIRSIIVQYMVEQGIFPDTALQSIQLPDTGISALQLRELELKYELEKEKMQLEKEKIQLEKEERIQLEKMHMENEKEIRLRELELKEHKPSPSHPETGFDATKNIRLVPKFSEKEVDKYFRHFEKIALSLKWPKEVWTLLLQSVLFGKARDTYSALSVEQSSDYDVVKEAILKAYELVPEAYRQKFRNTRKGADETHVEFAHQTEQLFDRWLASKQVDSLDKLKQLLLLEQFKNCIHSDIRTHLDEQKADTLNTAAVMADDYALTHKITFASSSSSKYPAASSGPKHTRDFKPFSKGGQNKSQPQSGDDRPKPHTDQSKGTSDKVAEKPVTGPKSRFVPTCTYCKKKGHIISECFKRENDEKRQNTSPNACAAVQNKNREALPRVQTKISDTHLKQYEPYITEGLVSLHKADANAKPVRILRDTGASQTLMLEGILPLSESTSTHSDVLIKGVDGVINVPLHKVHLKSEMVSGPVTVGVRPTLPIEGISILLGNDLANDKLISNPIVTDRVCDDNLLTHQEDEEIYPACVVTRAMKRRMAEQKGQESTSLPDASLGTDAPDTDVSLADSFLKPMFMEQCSDQSVKPYDRSVLKDLRTEPKIVPPQSCDENSSDTDSFDRNQLIAEQKKDPSLAGIRQRVLSDEELVKVPEGFFNKNGVLMRKWRPPDVEASQEWRTHYQIVVPMSYRNHVMSIAHDTAMAGHLGVKKTYDRVSAHFFWPKMKQDIAEYCRSCHTCQVVGKPNQTIPQAPLKPIPAFGEPFSRVLVDCVGPMTKTKSGNQYLLTIVCVSTRFPEAIPLRNIKANTIVKALIKFFTFVGLPKSIQSDQGSNFMSNLFQQVMHELGIKQYKSSAYHPESQGALERFHQTLKNMLRTYCLEYQKDWDEGVHLVLFAAREAVQESLGFSPFELIFGHSVRGPLKLLKEKWLGDAEAFHLLDYVSRFKERVQNACQLARDHLKRSQTSMKKRCQAEVVQGW